MGTMKDTPCGAMNCWQRVPKSVRHDDLSFMFVETDRWAFAPMMGELWVNFGDVGADVNGKFRLTPSTKAKLAADTFFYATMTVDTFSTGRRYPQMIISDQDVPVQSAWRSGTRSWCRLRRLAEHLPARICDHQYWDVNDQCPASTCTTCPIPTIPPRHRCLQSPRSASTWASIAGPCSTCMHRPNAFYMLLDGEPYGCAESAGLQRARGPVTVTFGDVLYHSGVDQPSRSPRRRCKCPRGATSTTWVQERPARSKWDEKRFPCGKTTKL